MYKVTYLEETQCYKNMKEMLINKHYTMKAQKIKMLQNRQDIRKPDRKETKLMFMGRGSNRQGRRAI